MKILKSCIPFAAVLLLALGACSPRISSKMTHERPSTVAPDNVIVYGPYDSVPAGYTVLGSVKVRGTGFSGELDYSDVVDMAKDVVSEKGGNALKVNKRTRPQALAKTTVNIEGEILWFDVLPKSPADE